MLGRFNLLDILYSLPAVFLAFSFHEFAHAFMAYRLGDPTPKFQGRLTLDPLAHVDWIGLIMFALFNFGWAKPVEINPSNFKNRKRDDILVTISGPIANLLLGFLAVIVSHLLRIIFPLSSILTPNTAINIIFIIVEKIAYLNIIFTFLNLIPLPPFDGYKVVKAFFFKRNVKFFWTLEKYSMIILLAMILFNVFGFLIYRPSMFVYTLLNKLASGIMQFFL